MAVCQCLYQMMVPTIINHSNPPGQYQSRLEAAGDLCMSSIGITITITTTTTSQQRVTKYQLVPLLRVVAKKYRCSQQEGDSPIPLVHLRAHLEDVIRRSIAISTTTIMRNPLESLRMLKSSWIPPTESSWRLTLRVHEVPVPVLALTRVRVLALLEVTIASPCRRIPPTCPGHISQA